MKNVKSFIESGILESYVMGSSSPKEDDLVEEMTSAYNEVREELDAINEALECYAFAHSVAPTVVVKPLLLTTVEFTERLKNGGQHSFPPELGHDSTVEDFSEWRDRPDMVVPAHSADFHARMIGHTPAMTTAIVWIKDRAPM